MAMTVEFTGLYTALLTPFKDGEIDADTFQSFIEWQIEQGVHGIVPCGTTGESPTLTHEEHIRVVDLAIEAAAGKVKVMAGAGSNSTAEAIAFTQHAKQAGADAVLLVSPYYNKPSQEGLYQHYTAIADAVEIPQFIYNIPGRSVINVTDETLARLSKHANIAGVKDATGDLARVSSLRALIGDELTLLSGEDLTAPGFNAQGGKGCISVTSNVAPKICADVQTACLEGDYVKALELHQSIVPLHQAMFCETNPIPVKYAASLMGKMRDEIRLPLTLPYAASQERIKQALQDAGLL